jgi:membrane protein DedA with SNARE-associated domain
VDVGGTASIWSGIDVSWLAKLGSLLVLPFAHEDLAIIAGAYIIVNDLMPVSLVALAIYGGIVASDFALYGIGAGARHLPWLNRYAIDERVQGFGDALKRNLFGLVALCRVVPGVVFVAFIACGWARVSLARFTVASLLVSALYLPLMLYLVIVFGAALDDYIGLWTWPALFAALIGAGFVRQRVFAFGKRRDIPALPPVAAGTVAAPRLVGPRALPSLAGLARKVALAERIPPSLFYLPLVLSWLMLGLRHRSLTLPSACNPRIPTGGMWGESKSDCLAEVTGREREWLAGYVVLARGAVGCEDLDLARALRSLESAGIDFPLVGKPDVGWHGYGVRRLDDAQALQTYLAHFPAGEKLILQKFVPDVGEAAVLYARAPGEPHGSIISLAFRFFPHVIGDGRQTVRDLIRTAARARWKAHLHLGFDPSHQGLGARDLDRVPRRGEMVQIALIGNQRAGGLYRDANCCITPELIARFDAIARSMPEFHYGRFDVRFASNEAFMRGEELSIVEINGIGGEAIDVWDPNLPVGEVYRRLLVQQRLLFMIGERNRARGFAPMPAGEFLMRLVRQTQLIRRYPASA